MIDFGLYRLFRLISDIDFSQLTTPEIINLFNFNLTLNRGTLKPLYNSVSSILIAFGRYYKVNGKAQFRRRTFHEPNLRTFALIVYAHF